MSEHPIESLMKTTMESIKEMVDVNTIVGDPVETPDGTVIIPISRVSFGFASGGGDYIPEKEEESKGDKDNGNGESKKNANSKFPFAGGAGAGVSVQPVAFMIVGNGQMKLMPVDQKANTLDNLLSMAPEVLHSIQSMVKKNKPNGKKNNSHHRIEYDDDEE
ncbi:GerW family sporulation protein [Alkaliphilus transvaalensis]|uniref:GerW family sporulation protein n=1 Tax=Alkaliphilus transvaalensis TaxID=114628 RepID=UPI00047E9633|nr:GerW family sporulation protein [Alkaliphilus transvaalensis]